MTFEYIWLMIFGDDNQIDPDYSVELQESLSLYFNEMTEEEKNALSQAAQRVKDYLLADPDENGFTPRETVTDEQKVMLNAFISGEAFNQFQ